MYKRVTFSNENDKIITIDIKYYRDQLLPAILNLPEEEIRSILSRISYNTIKILKDIHEYGFIRVFIDHDLDITTFCENLKNFKEFTAQIIKKYCPIIRDMNMIYVINTVKYIHHGSVIQVFKDVFLMPLHDGNWRLYIGSQCGLTIEEYKIMEYIMKNISCVYDIQFQGFMVKKYKRQY